MPSIGYPHQTFFIQTFLNRCYKVQFSTEECSQYEVHIVNTMHHTYIHNHMPWSLSHGQNTCCTRQTMVATNALRPISRRPFRPLVMYTWQLP